MTHVRTEELPEVPDPRAVYRLTANPRRGEEFWRERTDRNIGWITPAEQELLRGKTVGIAGCGGMGGLIADRMVRMGVGEIRITDLEVFDVSNINRQYAAGWKTIGVNKAVATARMLRAVADDTTLVVDQRGITEESADEFVAGSDLICDEIEFWSVAGRIRLHMAARAHNVEVLNCNTIGMGTRLFRFTSGSMTMEECLGMSYEEASELEDKFRKRTATGEEMMRIKEAVRTGLLPEIPEYCPEDPAWSTRDQVHKRLELEGKGAILATNPIMAAGFLSNWVVVCLLRDSGVRRSVIDLPPMPGYLYFDSVLGDFHVKRERW